MRAFCFRVAKNVFSLYNSILILRILSLARARCALSDWRRGPFWRALASGDCGRRFRCVLAAQRWRGPQNGAPQKQRGPEKRPNWGALGASAANWTLMVSCNGRNFLLISSTRAQAIAGPTTRAMARGPVGAPLARLLDRRQDAHTYSALFLTNVKLEIEKMASRCTAPSGDGHAVYGCAQFACTGALCKPAT